MTRLESGHAAPEFSLSDQDGNTVKLADYRGHRLLVYFYPKADTPGCTIQSCAVRDSLEDLKEAGVDAVGVSPDAPPALKKFDLKYSLGFPLLADPDHAVAGAYGVWGEKTSGGKTRMGIVRSAFLIDQQGKIAEAWYQVSPKDTVSNVKMALSR